MFNVWTLKNGCTQHFAILSPWDALYWVYLSILASNPLLDGTRKVCSSLSLLLERGPTHLSLECDHSMPTIIQRLSRFIRDCFRHSSRKDRLISVVRDSTLKGIWYPCLQGLDNWLDWERFAALELLVAIIGPQSDVLDLSFLLSGFTQLKRWFHRLKTHLGQSRVLSCSWG